MITGEKLCLLTGLTDRRHRQLALEGWFPPPKSAEYLLAPTLQGLFKYYREKATRQGGTLLEKKGVKMDKDIKLADLKIAREERKLIDRDEVIARFQHVGSRQRMILFQALETELPPRLDGMAAAQIRPILRDTADAICREMADSMGGFAEASKPVEAAKVKA